MSALYLWVKGKAGRGGGTQHFKVFAINKLYSVIFILYDCKESNKLTLFVYIFDVFAQIVSNKVSCFAKILWCF